MSEVRFAVVGIVGYARSHLNTLMELEEKREGIRLQAVVAKFPEEDPAFVDKLKARGVAIYDDVDQLLAEGKSEVDVVTLPTAIASHAPLSVAALQAGFHVLCEKPPAATVQDVDRMIAAAKASGKMCAIGFQDVYGPAIQRLKEMLVNGTLGEIQTAKCRASWPRNSSYYQRNRWAGRYRVGDDLVLDGPMNNALAHFLHTMLYLTGPSMEEAASVKRVQAEMYRARADIDGDDTGCLRLETERGIPIHFNVTHASAQNVEPVIEIHASNAKVEWIRSGETVIHYSHGLRERFDNDGTTGRLELFRDVAKVVRGEKAAAIGDVTCTRSFVAAINGAHESSGKIHPIPSEFVEMRDTPKGEQAVIADINAISQRAFDEGRLFSELGVPWAVATEPFSLEGYDRFPARAQG